MSLDDRSENKGKAYLIDQVSLKRLLFLAVIISVLPVVLIFVGKFTHILEWYFIILMYTITMFFFTYLFFQNFQKKLLQEMKALVKKEGIISGELLLVNTEEKLKNVLSLEFERCFVKNIASSVVFFDIDSLGEINSKYGYNTGDQIIIEIILSTKRYISNSQVLKDTGATLARVKGDTFALVMPNITEKTAFNETYNLKKIIETLNLGIKESITCRFAVVSFDQWISEDKFLDLAYEKLKLAKDYGKGVIL